MDNQTSPSTITDRTWPALRLEEWADTYHTLHMWTQIVGKIRLELAPKENHWWNSALYVNSRGLTTSWSPTTRVHSRFSSTLRTTGSRSIRLRGGERLQVGTEVGERVLRRAPCPPCGHWRFRFKSIRVRRKLPNPVPFELDDVHTSYQPEYANRCWRILLSTKLVLDQFRARFLGKASPVTSSGKL